MSSSATSFVPSVRPKDRLAVLFEEIAELCGQRNAIDGRLVEIVAEIDRDGLWGMTGARSVAAMVAWKTGSSPRNAEIVTAVAQRWEELPRCTQLLRDGRVSLDQVGVIAEKAGPGSDAHYAQLVTSATVNQLRTAIKLEPPPQPQPEPDPKPEPAPTYSKTCDDKGTTYRIFLPHLEAAKLDAAVQSHLDGMVADWKRDHADEADPDSASNQAPPMPTTVDAFMSLVEAGWDAEVARRPHGQRTTVVAHVDVKEQVASLHLGPLLSDADRRFLLCDATFEVWLERHGQPIGSGRDTRQISRRLRRALEHRDRCCVVPGCGATRGLHAHHIRHWEDGGATELDNLVLVCPYHHRMHHRGGITITGPAQHLVVTDGEGEQLSSASLARPPSTPPPDVPPCPGPTGERADWWWYEPFQPQPPPAAA
ncbi:HNH endonuclease signature motif containing protein [Mycolicibacterium arseniciresistens]|uniref:HNH endonuclease signature motif containing protein n=1 Tax=Mycolicibacterium arseniciresistens TaxID=3062257 RepID=A0ABT8U8Z5_9MYCO|nr:HNH endonuclease signature motif containing protein [Mycolicibacterium arseniciresistens]MDO3634268.1 HNH endonuclease signature motif containing protein [Mycolicibacterium arseniciresistens]